MLLSENPGASRRDFLAAAIASLAALGTPNLAGAESPSPRTPPYLSLLKYIEAGNDEFTEEKMAMEVRATLHRAVQALELPLAPPFSGSSPAAHRYEQLHIDLQAAQFDSSDHGVPEGWRRWVQSLGSVRRLEFYLLPENLVRFEVASESDGRLQYRVGHWKQTWDGNGKLLSFSPVEEHIISSPEPYFRDVTGACFAGVSSFADQLARGIPYWRSRLDPGTGIDIYGSNGIAVGDIDNDGRDEIYVCQPGGLPNRLYKFANSNKLVDITEQWGAGLLDDTSCALFLDLRNSGRQDLVVLRSGGPNLFLNSGSKFIVKEDAFRFATQPAGNFTGMAAADFDRDGKLDLYLCCYVYFQSEAQFTYASPYFDAQNGPPNFLFRNRLRPDGSGSFEDCTAETGMMENNNRFSFAPAWCDYNDDGWPDLYVANDFGRKNLYVNREGKFHDGAAKAGVEDIGPGMSASWFDYDGDGRPDLYVANMWSDAGQRIVRDQHFAPAHGEAASKAYQLHTRGNSLYRNRGDGTFEDTVAAEHANFGRWAWASGGHDLDNDGSPELFVTCGMLTNTSQKDLMGFFWRQVVANSPSVSAPSAAYQNAWNAINQFVREEYSWSGHEPNVLHVRRRGRYFDASGISGLDFAEDGRAFAVCDFDGDGRPDIILKSRLAPQVRLLQNNCAQNKTAIAFQLQGVRSNRDAIGARIRVDGQTKWLEAGSGFLSQHSKRLLFGLGQASSAKQVQILWPSGEQQDFENLAAGQTYFITESHPAFTSKPFQSHAPLSSKPVVAENRLVFEDTWFSEPVPLPEPHSGPAILVLQDGAAGSSSGKVTTVNLADGPPERRRKYEIFRRYLFDWRTSLQLPMAFLLNAEGMAVKVYAGVPSARKQSEDLARIAEHGRLAYPFPGHYLVPSQRDFFKFGVAFLWAGLPAEALPYLQEKSKRSPNNARVLSLIGQVYLAQQDFRNAEGSFRRSLAIDDKTPETFYGFGVALASQKQWEPARDALQRAILLRPAYPDAINDLGALYMQMGKPEEAIAAFRYGVQVSPDVDILYMNLARIYVKLGQLDRARQVMGQLLDRKPESQAARRALQELDGR